MPSVSLHQRKFEQMIKRRGKAVIWERAMRCSCFNEESGNPLEDCKACNGEGFIYDEPYVEDAVLVMSLALNKEFTPVGEYSMGDAVCTVPYEKQDKSVVPYVNVKVPMYWIGEHDKVTLLSTQFKATRAVRKGTWYRGREPDVLPNTYVTEILRIIQADSDTGDVTVYESGTDYNLDGNKVIWLNGGQAPADGTFYTVMYLHHPTYVVYTDLPQARDQDGQIFPRKVVLRYNDMA